MHIHRNPYDVFRSTRHLLRTTASWATLQRNDLAGIEERALRQYEEVFDAFFEERGLIPAGRLHEIGFERLEADPVGELRGLYDGLQLGDFDVAEPAVRSYLASIAGYEKNRLPEIEPHWKAEIARRWRRCFDEWGYAV